MTPEGRREGNCLKMFKEKKEEEKCWVLECLEWLLTLTVHLLLLFSWARILLTWNGLDLLSALIVSGMRYFAFNCLVLVCEEEKDGPLPFLQDHPNSQNFFFSPLFDPVVGGNEGDKEMPQAEEGWAGQETGTRKRMSVSLPSRLDAQWVLNGKHLMVMEEEREREEQQTVCASRRRRRRRRSGEKELNLLLFLHKSLGRRRRWLHTSSLLDCDFSSARLGFLRKRKEERGEENCKPNQW